MTVLDVRSLFCYTNPVYSPFLTASRLDLFADCAASAVLARTEEYSEAAAKGTETHADLLVPGRLPETYRAWFGREPRFEVGMAWHPVDGRAVKLGENLQRAYELDGIGWLAGTADALDVVGDVLSVADLKTGHAQTRGALGPPETSRQLRFLAWLAWRCVAAANPGWRPARIRLAWFMHQTQATGGVERWVEDAEVDSIALEAWVQRLVKRVEAAQNLVPAARPGEWCRWCPCFDSCQAQGDAIRRLAELPDGSVLDDAAAVTAFRALTAGERQIERAKKALATYVDRAGTVDIGNGKALKMARSTLRRIDARVAVASGIIPAHACDVSASQTSIAAAMPDADLDEVMARLEAAGAITTASSSAYVKVVRK